MRRLTGIFVAIAAVAACADPSQVTTSTTPGTTTRGTAISTSVAPSTTAPVSGEVSVRQLRLVDSSRPTPSAGGLDATDERVLETDVYLPPGDGPFPLILHAHGFRGNPQKFSELFTAWAEAGFMVASPRFPRSSDTGPGNAGIADYVEQPADISFVLDELLADAELGPRIDPDRLGISGLSLGGGTVYGLVYNDCCRDDRFRAAIVMSSLRFPFDREFGTNDIPVMILHGDADPALPYDEAVTSYEDSAPPKWFVHLLGGGHSEPYEDTPSAFDDLVTAVTIDFWSGTLEGDDSRLDAIAADGNVDGLGEVLSSRS